VSGVDRGELRRVLVGLVEAGVCVVMVFSLLGILVGHHWMLDLLSHFRLQYFWVLVLAALILGVMRRWRWCVVSGIAALVLGMTMVRYYLPVRGDGAGETLKMVSFNVHASNERYDEVVSFVREEDADVVLLMEINRGWSDQLGVLKEMYPHQVGRVRSGAFGVVLMSKIPFKEAHVRYIGEARVPSVEAVIGWDGGQLRILGTHPVPPRNGESSAFRNDQLTLLKEYVRGFEGETLVVAGDFNVSPFSSYYGRFLEGIGLRDSSLGFGLSPTWNRRVPWVAIPIDYVFVSEDVAVLERWVGPACGSDHSSVVVTLVRRE
jgi:endonuclease/exonuclease/phosphatase (EEP) superfamily protein YafD